jgi:hypothetical protein
MRHSRCALIVLTLSLCANLSRASDLYSLDSGGASGTIYKLNQSTAAESLVGPVGAAFTFPGDLASDTNSGTFRIWAPDITSNTLLKIDPATGAGTPVGLFTLPTGAPVKITSLAFNSVAGTLYGTTSTFYSGEADRLYSVNPSTGSVAPIGAAVGFTNIFALGFDTGGKLFGVSNDTHQLLSISTVTGVGGLVAPVAPLSIFDIATRPEDGVTFAVDAFPNQLYKLDLVTGATTLVGAHTTPHNMVGLAFGPVPEPSSLTLLALGTALFGLRRKR